MLTLGLAVVSQVSAFKIDFLPTFVPFANIPHIGQPIHEDITREAITNITPHASAAFISNLQHGVQNADILHQFDSESHFDNSSVVLHLGFAEGFTTMTQRLASARQNALANPEFLAPHYTSFLDITLDAVAALAELGADPQCLIQPACPTSRAAADAILISSFLPSLVVNPNPDTHRATNPKSLFHYPPDPNCQSTGLGLCGYLGPVQEAYLNLISLVDDSLKSVLGNHFDLTCLCDRNLDQVLGSSNSYVVRLHRLRNAIRAFRAHQDLGHAMHAAQDFFAHSDYVELMAGVAVGQAIPAGAVIPLPTDFSQFNLAGLQTIMGAARFNLLESGEVLTIWLGDGDYSLGNAGIQNFFNPITAIEVGGSALFGLNIPSISIASVGKNASPLPGFTHGHYLSSTALGLNKDSAPDPSASTDEPAHLNFLPARQAAVQVSSLLWASFLQSIGEDAPILLTCPPDKVVATDPGQCYATAVNLGAPAVSGGCQTPGVTNNAVARLLQGTNLVQWTATDLCGNSASCIQTVVVVDRELPRITCSSNLASPATSGNGAKVTFSLPAAVDNCPGVQVLCIPASGQVFPIGTNTVRCSAIDGSSNHDSCSFTVRVQGAAEQIQVLATLVSSFHFASSGLGNSFTVQLKTALGYLLAGNKTAACGSMQVFINHVSAQSGKSLTRPQSSELVLAATRITMVIKGTP